jgi:hypothetical protein
MSDPITLTPTRDTLSVLRTLLLDAEEVLDPDTQEGREVALLYRMVYKAQKEGVPLRIELGERA